MTTTGTASAVLRAIIIATLLAAEASPGRTQENSIPVQIQNLANTGQAADRPSPQRLLQVLSNVELTSAQLLRGQPEESLSASLSSSMALIITPDYLGSGTLIERTGLILTTATVLAGASSVGVVMKSNAGTTRPRSTDALMARLVRIDEVADLALLKLNIKPPKQDGIKLHRDGNILAGQKATVIGHPYGEVWSTAQGVVISPPRQSTWTGRQGRHHKAQIITLKLQSRMDDMGAALINETGALLGISTTLPPRFPNEIGAIAATEISRFLETATDRRLPGPPKSIPACQVKLLHTSYSAREKSTTQELDLNCNGKADAWLIVPDEKSKPVLLQVDANENTKIEARYVDRAHDGTFDSVHFDVDEDGTPDLEGAQLDDNLQPQRLSISRR